MQEFWLCLVTLFVAVDAIGVLPIFMSLTDGIDPRRLNRVILQSILTAGAVAVAFILAGVGLLRMLGIQVADFMVAGGLLLLTISVSDLISGTKSQRKIDLNTVGAVPIGVPLITGPAVLTTSVLLTQQHGWSITAAAVVVNVIVAGAVFLFAKPISRFLGSAGSRTLSKIASILLAAFAVRLIRVGLQIFLGQTPG